VTIVVAPDGQTLSFQAAGLGNVSGTCTGIGFGPITGVPITNHTFNISESSGQITASGNFGSPGSAAGGAQALAPAAFCTTGSQAWTAETPAAWADAAINRLGDLADTGYGVYNTTGAGQTRSWKAKRGQARTFGVTVVNSGTEAGRIDIKGCGPSRGFKVRYESVTGTNITSQVLAGTFGQERDPGATVYAAMIIKVTKRARIGKTKTCAATGISDANRDVVKAKLKVKRG
jgi:hypothetical protein